MTNKEIALRLTEASIQLEIAILNSNVSGYFKSPKEIYDNTLEALNKDKQ